MSDKENKPVNNMDDLLNRLGIFRRFHFTTFCGLQLLFSAVAFSLVHMVYAGMTPDWHCNFHAHQNNSYNAHYNGSAEVQEKVSYYGTNLTTLSVVSRVDSSSQTFKVCSVNGTKCDTFIFVASSRTIVSEWSLVCDRAWIKRVMISVQMAGGLLGILISGHLGDQFGRKKVLYAFLLIHSVTNFIAGSSVSWEMFAVCKFVDGHSLGAISITLYPYHIEMSPQRWRSILAGFPAFSFGFALFAGVAFALEDWSHLNYIAGALITPFLLGWFFFPESPRWLAVHDKLHEAENAVKKIARVNQKPIPPGTLALFTKIATEEKNTRKSDRIYSFFDLFSTFHFAKLSLAGACMYCAMAAVDYGITFGLSSLDGNMFLNIFLMQVLQIPLQFTVTYTVNKFGRRISALVYFIISILASTGCLILPFLKQESSRGAISSGLSLTVRSALIPALNVVALLCLEGYPTVMRNLGYSFIVTCYALGGIIAPFIINFEQKAVVTYGIMTALLVLCAFLVLIMPETKDVPLADSTAMTAYVVPQDNLHLEDVHGDLDCSSSNNVKA